MCRCTPPTPNLPAQRASYSAVQCTRATPDGEAHMPCRTGAWPAWRLDDNVSKRVTCTSYAGAAIDEDDHALRNDSWIAKKSQHAPPPSSGAHPARREHQQPSAAGMYSMTDFTHQQHDRRWQSESPPHPLHPPRRRSRTLARRA